MGFFDKIKAAVGVGGVKVKIILDDENATYGQGDDITGHLQVTGGSADQTINRLSLQLKRKWTEVIEEQEVIEYADGRTEVMEDEESETNTDVLDEIAQDEPIQINSDYDESFPFEFNIPYMADISIDKSLEYFLYARADVPGAPDPKDRINIKINPSEEIQAIEQVLIEGFNFDFQGEFSQDGWINAEFITKRMKFAKSPEVIGLSMINNEEGVELILYPDLAGMSFIDYLRTESIDEPVKYEIFLPYEQIAPNDEVNLQIISDAFEKVFTDLNWA